MVSLFDIGASQPCPDQFNMAAYVLARARSLGAKTALEILGSGTAQSFSYDALEAAVLGTATGLLNQGLAPGDRVLMRLGNTVEFPLTYLACLAVDLVPVPTSAQLTQPEVDVICHEIAPSLIVAGDAAVRPATPPCPVLDEDALVSMRSLPPARYIMGDPGRLGYIIYTSGTSGLPRAVCHAHRAVWARRMMWDGWYDLQESDRMLHAGAFNWTYTLGTGLMDPWACGATALIPEPGTKPAALPALLRNHDATLFAAAPGVFRQILKSGKSISAPTLRHALCAGEKLPATTRTAWEAATGTRIYEAYGMSECSTFVSGSPARPPPDGASGYPQPGRRVAVISEGQPVGFNTEGVLGVDAADPGLMLGYWQAPQETRARFSGTWFLTGDSVSMAADGAITYLGRADDMMNAGGFRVSPLEVESVLNAHPDVQESAVAEVRLKADTTVIAAFYVAETSLAENALSGFAAARLARYKMPRLFIPVPELPKGANGKLLRKVLRQKYEEANDQT